jgi:uncharacterized membrane protein
MNDAINRTIAAKARNIMRIEQALVVFSGAFTAVMTAVALYFEKLYGVGPYSLAFLVVCLGVSLVVFWAFFSVFRDAFRYRTVKKGTRGMMTLASAYMVIASLVAYSVAFGFFGLRVPWTGDGREYLYVCYFLLSVGAVFLARSTMFYWRLRKYMIQSLGSLVR